MEEELYGALQYHSSGTSNSICDYYCSYVSDQNMVVPPPPPPPPLPSPPGFPVFGAPEQLVSGSMVSDAASMQKGGGGDRDEEVSSAIIRARIASHPLYPKLVHAYLDCQKVGAPPEVACLLDEIRLQNDPSKVSAIDTSCLGADPELDDFMETYCDILVRYKSDLSRPFDEATFFLNDIEAQFHSLCNGSGATLVSDEAGGSSDEGGSGGGDAEARDPSCPTEDRELKDKLLRKYSGYITTLKQEFSKKKKKGKLPKEATQILFNWWNVHYKWPYPTESDKVALADLTGLDQKQINNWFINQRKRHWKPTENMQFTLVDSLGQPFFMNE